jgi:hypothetical protein
MTSADWISGRLCAPIVGVASANGHVVTWSRGHVVAPPTGPRLRRHNAGPPSLQIDLSADLPRKGEENMESPDANKEVSAIIDRLERQFPGVPPPEVVAVVLEAHDAFNDYPIGTHMLVLVERHAKDRLGGRGVEPPHP